MYITDFIGRQISRRQLSTIGRTIVSDIRPSRVWVALEKSRHCATQE